MDAVRVQNHCNGETIIYFHMFHMEHSLLQNLRNHSYIM